MPASKLTANQRDVLAYVVRVNDRGATAFAGDSGELQTLRSLRRRGLVEPEHAEPGPRWRATAAGREEVRDAH